MKFHSVAANGLATGTFPKCSWGQIDPMVDRGLRIKRPNLRRVRPETFLSLRDQQGTIFWRFIVV